MLQINNLINQHSSKPLTILSSAMAAWIVMSVCSPRLALKVLPASVHGAVASGLLYLGYKSVGLVKHGLQQIKNPEKSMHRMTGTVLVVLSTVNIAIATYLLNYQMNYLSKQLFR